MSPVLRSVRNSLAVTVVLATLVGGARPASGTAQVVRGRVLDPSGPGSIGGAMVVLLDEGDRERDATLTNATGSFQLGAPGPGRYRLRADRIGYRSVHTALFELAPGDTVFRTVEVRVEAIPLAGIEVEGSGRCRVWPEEGMATARAWEEARKALASARWTDEMGVYRYRLMSFVRTRDLIGRTLEPTDSTVSDQFLRTPFHAAPAERLLEDGFARREGEGHAYFGPDAAVLLSDVFLDTHCMRLRRGEDEAEGLLGLEFEPVGDRDVVEIRGTLWIDPESSELRWLDYRYVGLGRLGIRGGNAGGSVLFQGLPNGAWIIRRWEIRMPLVDAGDRSRVVGYRVEGARVLQVRDERGRVVPTGRSSPGPGGIR